jgi:hypothetical protein
MLLVSTVFWMVQPALAQTDQSHGRILGLGAIGYLWPPAFSVRLWLGHTLGLEGILGFAPSTIVSGIVVSGIGIGGGLLLKFIDTPLLDLYLAGRVGVVNMQIASMVMSLVGATGALGLELSFIHLLAFSLELVVGGAGSVAVSEASGAFGTTAAVGGFALVFGWAVHIYF